MPSYDKYKNSKYVQKTDVDPPVLVTIERVTEEDVSGSDQPEDVKYVVYFKENVNPWVPGITMLDMIHQIAGDGDTDHWDYAYRLDKKQPAIVIVLYVDKTVTYKGKLVGGIRCRPPKQQLPPDPEPQQVDAHRTGGQPNPDWVGDNPPPPTDDNIPF